MPDIVPHYAVKSCPEPLLMKELAAGGVKFDCASGREIREVLCVGKDSEKNIIFANPHKVKRDIELARDVGVQETVVDSEEEIGRIAESGWRPNLLVRLAVEDAGSRSPFSIKFGAEANSWSRIFKKAEMEGLEIRGCSFHIGSGCKDLTQYERAIDICRRFFIEAGRNVPNRIDTVDIGGGFMPGSKFIEAARIINESRKRWQNSPYYYPQRWIAEPGRFFSAPSHCLYTPVIMRKRGIGGKGWRYIIDESIYGQFSCIPFDHSTPKWIHLREDEGVEEERGEEGDEGYIFGRTCDSIDLIAYSEKMPRLKEGDWLCFPGMGAYTSSSASEFNGFPKPDVLWQDMGWIDEESVAENGNIIYPVYCDSRISLSKKFD